MLRGAVLDLAQAGERDRIFFLLNVLRNLFDDEFQFLHILRWVILTAGLPGQLGERGFIDTVVVQLDGKVLENLQQGFFVLGVVIFAAGLVRHCLHGFFIELALAAKTQQVERDFGFLGAFDHLAHAAAAAVIHAVGHGDYGAFALAAVRLQSGDGDIGGVEQSRLTFGRQFLDGELQNILVAAEGFGDTQRSC